MNVGDYIIGNAIHPKGAIVSGMITDIEYPMIEEWDLYLIVTDQGWTYEVRSWDAQKTKRY